MKDVDNEPAYGDSDVLYLHHEEIYLELGLQCGMMQNQQLILVGVLVHLVFFYSIFDIYFTSPLVHGMTPHKSPLRAPAKRLVLFVADGLRADKFFEIEENGKSRAPYLRHVIEKTGAWGVSHTRVPTESRPGHVALIAGFYEDVSAVAKGWKENPVEFDSVFNESRYTWSWGSPDILPMFAKGASGDHVVTYQYPAHLEDFAGSDSSKLDTWVFDKFKEFLNEGSTNPALQERLHQDRIVFFLHLLGIDTNGHAHNPHSQEYFNNIRVMDSGIQEVVSQLQQFYGDDGKTAFIMSSDHGMTNWGSHGAGHATETLTPLVAWGAGVRTPVTQEESKKGGKYSEDWQLNHLRRSDVEQADIAPLMAALIGVPFPLNSVGRLPVDYLSCSDPEKAEIVFANTQQILAQYQVKMEEKKNTTLSPAFRPFKDLSVAVQMERVRTIRNLIKTGNYQQAITECQDLMSLALEGLNYYQKYDRFFLGVSITCGFVGWTMYVLIILLEEFSGVVCVKTKLDILDQPWLLQENAVKTCFGFLAALILILLAVQSLPWTYYLYCLIPVGLWMQVCLNLHVLQETVQHLWKSQSFTSFISVILACCLGLEVLVMGFFRRELLSIGLVCLAVWPWTYWNTVNDRTSIIGWSVCCSALAVFPMLPVVGRATDYNLVLIAGVAAFILCFYSVQKMKLLDSSSGHHNYNLNYVQMVFLCVSVFIVMSTSSSVSNKLGLPLLNQIISWLILAISLTMPVLSGTGVLQRLLTICLGFLCPYILLSISHEAVFVVCLCCLMYFWLRVEATLISKNKKLIHGLDFVMIEVRRLQKEPRYLEITDVRRGFFFIFFILTGFFGTGNIASINSFEPASVYCFLTVFNPFVMGSLMMVKNVIPMVLVTCGFRAIHIVTHIPIRALFLVVLIMSDLMALNFFFLVRDYGSWLEIGTSISHYVIVMCIVIFLMLLFGLSHVLTTYSVLKNKRHPQ